MSASGMYSDSGFSGVWRESELQHVGCSQNEHFFLLNSTCWHTEAEKIIWFHNWPLWLASFPSWWGWVYKHRFFWDSDLSMRPRGCKLHTVGKASKAVFDLKTFFGNDNFANLAFIPEELKGKKSSTLNICCSLTASSAWEVLSLAHSFNDSLADDPLLLTVKIKHLLIILLF